MEDAPNVVALTDRELDLLGDLVMNVRPTSRGVHHWHDLETVESLRDEVEAAIQTAAHRGEGVSRRRKDG